MTWTLDDILASNLFMQCDTPNQKAFSSLPDGFTIRLCRRNELAIWKDIFAQGEYIDFVNYYYDKVYAPFEDDFFQRCLFVVDKDDKPIATSGIWLSYGKINTLLGFFVIPEYEGFGIGRALLSEVMKNANYPVYLHTHLIASKAIKLYLDFGYQFITDNIVGYRNNDIQKSLSYLKEILTIHNVTNIPMIKANSTLLEAALLNEFAEF
jgi:GNAT superfamily N-acetyltransferase